MSSDLSKVVSFHWLVISEGNLYFFFFFLFFFFYGYVCLLRERERERERERGGGVRWEVRGQKVNGYGK